MTQLTDLGLSHTGGTGLQVTSAQRAISRADGPRLQASEGRLDWTNRCRRSQMLLASTGVGHGWS